MTKATQDILNEAIQLPISERAEIASALLASLNDEPSEEAEEAWAAEIVRRAERVRSGQAAGRPWAEVQARLEHRRR